MEVDKWVDGRLKGGDLKRVEDGRKTEDESGWVGE